MAIVGVLLLGTLIVAYEAPALYWERRYRDLVIFFIFTGLGLTLSVLLLLEVPLTSIATYIENATTFLRQVIKLIMFRN